MTKYLTLTLAIDKVHSLPVANALQRLSFGDTTGGQADVEQQSVGGKQGGATAGAPVTGTQQEVAAAYRPHRAAHPRAWPGQRGAIVRLAGTRCRHHEPLFALHVRHGTDPPGAAPLHGTGAPAARPVRAGRTGRGGRRLGRTAAASAPHGVLATRCGAPRSAGGGIVWSGARVGQQAAFSNE